jgi:hypothetical protein
MSEQSPSPFPEPARDRCNQLPDSQRTGPVALDSRTWLGQHHEGTLSYMSGCGPRSVTISYALVGEEILLQVPDYNEIAHYAPGAQVSFAVADEIEARSADQPDPAICEVRVTATAQLESDARGHPPVETLFDESWPDGIMTSIVTLPLTDLQVSARRPAESLREGHPTSTS